MKSNTSNMLPAPGAKPLSASTFVKDVLTTWEDLLPSRRRDIASALRRLAVSCDVPLSTIYLTHEAVAGLVSKAERNCQPVHPNNRTHIRFVLTRLAGGVWSPMPAPLSEAWAALYSSIDCEYDRHGIVRFLRFCSTIGCEPGRVSRATLMEFEEHLVANEQHLKPSRLISSTVSAWNRARRTTAGWPDVALSRGAKPRTCTLALDSYPPSFQADVIAFQQRITRTSLTQRGDRPLLDPYSQLGQANQHGRAPPANRRRKPARPATVKGRTYQILQAAAALVQCGRRQEDLVSLRSLIDPIENAAAIADFMWQKAGEKPNANAAGPIEVLRQIAKYHCMAAPEVVDAISEWFNQCMPPRRGRMTQKNARRLQQLITTRNLAVLLHLPQSLMDDAENCGKPREAARMALFAVAIETLLICPMRLKNLRFLQLGTSVINVVGSPSDSAYFCLEPDETKTEEPLLWPIPAASLKLIRRYVSKFRPAIVADGNDYLFPGKARLPRSECGMRDALVKPLAARNILANPHLMRHFAVWLYLRRRPGAYEIVRRILGHRNLETTIRYYAGLEAQFAAISYDDAVLHERHVTRKVAKIALAGPRRRIYGKEAQHGRVWPANSPHDDQLR